MLTTKKLLERIHLYIPFDALSSQITSDFGLGSPVSFEPLPVGYEEVNSLLVTSKGKYIVKIFSKDKDTATINSNVTALLEYYKGGIPVPKLYQHSGGEYLYRIEGTDTYLVVMDYFDGKKFIARGNKDGKTLYLGIYETAQEAHNAYCEHAKKTYGQFYRAS